MDLYAELLIEDKNCKSKLKEMIVEMLREENRMEQ